MNELLVFAKAPRPGLVKTRLAASIGAAEACQAYRAMLATLAASLRTVEQATVLYSPADAQPALAPLFPSHWRYAPQADGHLGIRIAQAFAQAHQSGSLRPIIIGTDCPFITLADLESAWAALASYDTVFGPAEDGGYWLVGARRAPEGLFEHIDWSTPAVLRQNLERCTQLHLSTHLLRTLPDIDTAEDWTRHKNRLHELGPSAHPASTSL